MREQFKANLFRVGKVKKRIETANSIIDRYLGLGMRLTVRQLYYQFVAHHNLDNTPKEYKRFAHTISEARLAGLIDWDAIEDRIRVPRAVPDFESLDQCLGEAIAGFRLPRWEGQEAYAELWVEKDALAGVLEPMVSEFHVTLMVNRGFSSQSAMYEASKRLLARGIGKKKVRIFYLGDHDPSGEDMVRDIHDRLRMFGCKRVGVEKVALTMAQIREHEPPPNPVKVTDTRASDYIAKHGNDSWEVDALDPEVLQAIIRRSFEAVIDRPKMDAMIERERREKKTHARLRARVASPDEWAREILEEIESASRYGEDSIDPGALMYPDRTMRKLRELLTGLDGEDDPE